jgi:two-component sensor histidine kinase
LYVRHGGRWTPYAGPFQNIVPDVRYMALGGDARLWVGTRNLGLVGFTVPRDPGDSGKSVPADTMWYGKCNGLQSNWITYVREDSLGRLWVTSFGGGLAVIDGGSVRNLALAAPAEDGFFTALDDRSGFLWLSSNSGVYRVRVADLLQVAGGTSVSAPWTQFGLGAGMVSDECNGAYQSSGFRGRDGKLWFPTTAGAIMVAPDSLPMNTVPPSVVIERARIDREDVVRSSGIASSYGDREFEFGYTGISLAAPELVQFRIMLEGYDRGWIDVGGRKICSYTNLSPGAYIFRVQARNADGVWNLTGAAFPFRVSPRFYQTWWFFLFCGICVMTAGAGLHAVYRRDRDRQLVSAQLESRLAQAQLKVLEMQVQPHFLFNTLNGITALIRDDPEKATTMITRLSEFVRMALDRSGVQEISLREELLFVDRYLQIELLRFADRLTVRKAVDDELLDALVPAMILQPLVENAIRHGVSKRRGPVTIRIRAARENGSLTLHVCDNGAGFVASSGTGFREGVGLTNTRERLRQLYGEYQRMDFVSIATGGVEVALTIPLHKEPVRTWTESAR